MTREEEFELFKNWLIPRLDYKKGAFYQMDLKSNDYDGKAYVLTLGIITGKKEVDEYYKILDNNINKQK